MIAEAKFLDLSGESVDIKKEALLALSVLGFSKSKAENIVSKVYFENKDIELQELIKKSLNKGENCGVIQIGPNKCTTINELGKIIVDYLDKNITLKHDLTKPVGDIGRSANYQKAKNILDWEPKVTLEYGLKDLIQWLVKN